MGDSLTTCPSLLLRLRDEPDHEAWTGRRRPPQRGRRRHPARSRFMPYTAEISRTNPTSFLFLVDQSSSMLEPFGAQPHKQKAEGVADAINRLLQNLVLKCAKSEGIRDYPNCYPPLVINITDGMSTDGDPLPAAMALQELASSDGNVLLFNAHVSAHRGQPIEFPASDSSLADHFARLLFSMSSPLPPRLLEAARSDGFTVATGARGFVFNADLVSVIRFLDVGTRVARGVP
jgi:hypothetical protein